MSSALVRQALEFVDQDESAGKKAKGSNKRRPKLAQALNPYTRPNKPVKQPRPEIKQSTEDTIKKLLALSKPIVNNSVAEKIISRAQSGKAVIKLEAKKEEPQSILFADDLPPPPPKARKLKRRERPEAYRDFESDPFCS